MTEKRQTSQGNIILILQHFATKLRNITNFVMLFQTCLDQNFTQKGKGLLVLIGPFQLVLGGSKNVCLSLNTVISVN
jgi:uncharacterized membrane protein